MCIRDRLKVKSDNILIATGGNVALGVAMMLLAATTIVFGGLTPVSYTHLPMAS